MVKNELFNKGKIGCKCSTIKREKGEIEMEKVQQTIRAARGTELQTKGWVQEAALRMLMNNLDPEVAEKPEELVVYGGIGRCSS